MHKKEEKLSLKQQIYSLMQKDSLEAKSLSNLFSFIANTYSVKEETVKSTFYQLVSNGDLVETKKGKFVTVPSQNYAKATFIGNARGFGFAKLEKTSEKDIFIPANMTKNALDGDKIVVKIASGGEDGEVVAIYKPIRQLVGVVRIEGQNQFVEPSNPHIPLLVKVIRGPIKVKKDERVVIELRRNEKVLSGVICERLGDYDDIKAIELGLIREHELYETFRDEVLAESKKIPQKVKKNQKIGRLDLTKEEIFTIDGEDAKDLDDAISIKRVGKGYELGVHIADVGEYVKQGGIIDEEAMARGTSVYFPTSVLPMLPVSLSNGICSLNEGVERLTLSCIMQINEEGEVIGHKICESVIKSVARLTYTDAIKVIEGGKGEKAEKVRSSLIIMAELAKKLENRRKKCGSLDFSVPECEFVFDENGIAIDVKKREVNDAHRLIEQFMVLANETVAKHFNERKIPFVYRVHEPSEQKKVEGVLEFMKSLGINVPKAPKAVTPQFYQNLIKLVAGKPYEQIINKILLRSMQKARYLNQNLGHFGLALENYCHFTSPIRRYPDLTIHRIIKEVIHSKNLTEERKASLKDFTYEASQTSSDRERNADSAERDVDDLWKAYLMRDRVGEEFDGLVSSVTNYGIYVELDNSVEGLVRIEDLPQDAYLYMEKSLRLKGQHHSFGIGDKVHVTLTKSNIYTRKVDFSMKN